ncbi:hypothetical protein BHM03_00019675 [Ensete ventricosum]|nr:hypothetical protein BHM03_00019675 [Ensete ventricosum]
MGRRGDFIPFLSFYSTPRSPFSPHGEKRRLHSLLVILFSFLASSPGSGRRKPANEKLPMGKCYRYVDRPLPSGTAKIDRRRSISAVGSRFRPSAVDFSRRRSIEGEKGKKKKKRKRRGEEEYLTLSSPACRCRPWVARELSSPTHRRRLRVAR